MSVEYKCAVCGASSSLYLENDVLRCIEHSSFWDLCNALLPGRLRKATKAAQAARKLKPRSISVIVPEPIPEPLPTKPKRKLSYVTKKEKKARKISI